MVQTLEGEELMLTVTTDRGLIKGWLRSKRVTLWSDWAIIHPDSMEIAVDWFVKEMSDLSAYVAECEHSDDRD